MEKKPLTEEEFEKALMNGHGRAYLHIKHFGSGEYEGLLLDACMRFSGFDPQLEESRASWLYSMIDLAGLNSACKDAILEALQVATDDWDIKAMVELLEYFAAAGSSRARDAIYTAFDDGQTGESDWIGEEQIVRLDGIEGFLHIAEIRGAICAEDPEAYWPDSSLEELIERFGENEVMRTVADRAKESQYLRLYLEQTEPLGYEPPSREERAETVRAEKPLEEILSDALGGVGEYPGRYMMFGQYANDQEIEEVFNRLLNPHYTHELVRLLWVFRRRPLPRLHEMLLDHARSEDEQLSDAAIVALAHASDEVVHRLGVEILSMPDWERAARGVELFRENFRPADAQLINQVLTRAPQTADLNVIHWAARELLDVVERHPTTDLVESVAWVYENTPCSACRETAVRQLVELDSAPPALLEECLVDANPDIRELAEEQLGGKSPVRLLTGPAD